MAGRSAAATGIIQPRALEGQIARWESRNAVSVAHSSASRSGRARSPAMSPPFPTRRPHQVNMSHCNMIVCHPKSRTESAFCSSAF